MCDTIEGGGGGGGGGGVDLGPFKLDTIQYIIKLISLQWSSGLDRIRVCTLCTDRA